jgi:two-component system cell cycle response regulator
MVRARNLIHVDWNPRTRVALSHALEARGFHVRAAADSAAARAAFLDGSFDAALIDLGSIDASIALCRELKELASSSFVPTILLTESPDPAPRVRALRMGVDDACPKSIDIDELDARLSVLLRTRQREEQLRSETGKLRAIAFADPLTGLGNRRAFESELERAWARATRSGGSLGLFLLDIDHFKRFNDQYGHRTGDAVLRAVGRAVAREIRAGDQVFRFGGEEFAVLAPDAARDGVAALGDRVRRAIAGQEVLPPPGASWQGPLSVTASVGVALVPDAAIPTKGALIECADRALYRAKAEGRDRVSVFGVRHSPARAPVEMVPALR